MAAPVSSGRWFGLSFLRHKPAAQGTLTLPQIREECRDVKVELRCELFADSVNFRHNRVFPHDARLP